jgi:hypothetical protein
MCIIRIRVLFNHIKNKLHEGELAGTTTATIPMGKIQRIDKE